MATLNQLINQCDNKLPNLIQAIEAGKVQDGTYTYQSPRIDGDLTIFVNTATDKDGNAGYYIVITGTVGANTYQKIVRQHADVDDSKDWFKLLTYV